jgi:hypothetical protein
MGSEQQNSLNTLKQLMCQAVQQPLYIITPGQPFCLYDEQTMFDIHGLRQFVPTPTRSTNGVSTLLDLVVGREGSRCISDVAVHTSHHVSDHDIVTWSMASRLKPVRQLVDYKFRSLKNVDWSSFQDDVLSSDAKRKRRELERR